MSGGGNMIKRTKEYCRDRLNDMFLYSSGANDYSNSELRQYWMPDAVSVDCYDCNAKFNTFRRKHHCRVCGQIFCSNCSSEYIDGKSLGFSGKLRVCKFCYDFFFRFLKGLEPGASTELLSKAANPSPASKRFSVFYSAGSSETVNPHNVSVDVLQFYLSDPHQLGRLWIQVLHPDTGVFTAGDGVSFTGRTLVNWLRKRDESTSVEQAIAIGQALLDARFMIAEDFRGPHFQNSSVVYKSMKNDIVCEDVNEDFFKETDCPDWLRNVNVRTPEDDGADRNMTSSVSSVSDISSEIATASSPMSPSLLDNITLSTLKEDSLNPQPVATSFPISKVPNSLDLIYSNHMRISLRYLMAQERLSPEWFEYILRFTEEAVKHIKLDAISRNDSLDIRNYIRIKKIPYGNRDENSKIFFGLMIRNKPYCGRKEIHKARIMIVLGSIAFNRTKYASLDTYIVQEDEYLKNICCKIKSFKPDVIFVQETITYQAKEILANANIVLVQNIKLNVLERISRYFDTPMLSSLDSIPNQPELGSCDLFRVQSFQINSRFVSPEYIIMESATRRHLGCTLVLRGGPPSALSKVKRLIKQMSLIRNNIIYEKAFLENEFVKIDLDNEVNNVLSLVPTILSPFIRAAEEREEIMKDMWEYDDEKSSIEDPESTTKSTISKRTKSFFPSLDSDKLMESLSNFRAEASDRPLSLVKYAGPKVYKPSKEQNSLVPTYYKNCKTLPVLFSSYSSRSRVFPSYCIVPWVVEIQYYGANDLPLGVFLETFCFSEFYLCPNKMCSASMKDHVRRFCLDDGNVNMYIQSLSNPISRGEENDDPPPIVTWKYCVECEKLGPVVELSEKSWSYSFTMFLSLLVYEGKLKGGGGKKVCSHSLHHQHYTCFSRGLLVVSFKYSRLSPFSMALPPRHINVHPYLPSIESVTVDVRELAMDGTLIFSQIHEKLTEFETKEMPPCLNEKFSDLSRRFEENSKEFRVSVKKLQSLIEKLEEPDISREDKEKYTVSIRRHSTGLKQDLSDKISGWKEKLQSYLDAKRKEEKGLDGRTRSASGNLINTSSSASNSSSEVEESMKKDEANNSSTPSRLWPSFSSNNAEIVLRNKFPPHVHYGLHSPNYIVVDETQPSSIISYVFTTGDYLEYLSTTSSSAETSSRSPHFDYEFSDGEHAKFYCNAYFAWDFESIRRSVLSEPKDFVVSLAECEPWKSSGGKSGLNFFKTKDDRFILKEMSLTEFHSFREFAPQYFEYLKSSLDPQENKPSVLAKILGVYKVGFKNSLSKKSLKMDILVIENVFYGRKIVEKYDLKGSMRNRLVDIKCKTPDEGGALVLMDENLLKVACDRPLFIRKACQDRLLKAIDRDTDFLQNASIMDYSLLVGIDSTRNELVLGIIDYIRIFSWDKKLENLIKKSGLLGGKPGHSPTIIPPKIYKKRFIEAMFKYFIVVPEVLNFESHGS